MVKTLKSLLRNRWTNFKETWREALMAKVLQCRVCINHDPMVTLTYFTTRSTWVNVPNAFEWGKTFKKSFEVKILQETGINDSEKKLDPRAHMPPPQGIIHVYYHNIQTSSPLKPLGQLKPNFMRGIYRMGNECIY